MACSICGYTPPVADVDDEEAERIGPSDFMAGRPLTCFACEDVAEAEVELAKRRRQRDERLNG
jgi:hypothetical protein